MISIPAFHVSGQSLAKGKGKVFIASRQDSSSSGNFIISIVAQFDPATDDYPTGSLKIDADLSDSTKGVFTATSIELVNSYGRLNPTIYLTGRCKSTNEKAPKGLRYWLMIADNRVEKEGTPEIVGFVVHDRDGNWVTYGMGPFLSGNIQVAPN